MRVLLTRGLFAILIIYCIIVVVMYIYQKNLIFFPQSLSSDALSLMHGQNGVEEVTRKMKDNTNLKGWFVTGQVYGKPGLLIYYGGNAEEVSWLIEDMKKLKGWNVVLMNYRGYGQSEGVPGEKGLFSDALEIFDCFAAREKPGKIAVMGRSLGTGVATYLAANRKVNGVVLVSPYDSVTSVAKEQYLFACGGTSKT